MADTNRRNDDCTPEARVTKSLFGYGVLAGVLYVVASVVQGLLTRGFSFTRDSWSVLSLGAAGWVHIVVFILTGLFVIAAAVAFRRHLAPGAGHRAWVFLGIYGLLLIVAGISLPDATGASFSVHGTIHLAAGGLGFITFAVAAFIVARRFFRSAARGWAWFSLAAGILLLLGFGALASGKSSTVTILLFTAAVILSWLWLALVSVRFYREADVIGRADAAALKK